MEGGQGPVKAGAFSIEAVIGIAAGLLAALRKDHDFLLEGGVFTEDVIHYWIEYKRLNEVDQLRIRPHPYEFCMYFDV